MIFIIILDIYFISLPHTGLLLACSAPKERRLNAEKQQTTIFHSRALFLVCLFFPEIFLRLKAAFRRDGKNLRSRFHFVLLLDHGWLRHRYKNTREMSEIKSLIAREDFLTFCALRNGNYKKFLMPRDISLRVMMEMFHEIFFVETEMPRKNIKKDLTALV